MKAYLEQIKHFMVSPIVSVECSLNVSSTIKLMFEGNLSSVPVVGLDKKMLGIFVLNNNQKLFLDIASEGMFNGVLESEVQFYMTKNFMVASVDDNVLSVLEKMRVYKIDNMMIVDKNIPVGSVSVYDLLDVIQKINEKRLEQMLKNIKHKNRRPLDKDRIIKILTREISVLQAKSTTDHLTGLFNIRYFNDRTEEEVDRARRYKEKISILFLDIDRFKRVNDTFGHECGNEVLRHIGRLLKQTSPSNDSTVLRKSDIAVRFGGEEFLILCPSTDKNNAAIIAERLRSIVETSKIEYEGTVMSVTVSIGVAEFDSNSDSIAQTVTAADKTMYDAKKLGGNKVVVY